MRISAVIQIMLVIETILPAALMETISAQVPYI